MKLVNLAGRVFGNLTVTRSDGNHGKIVIKASRILLGIRLWRSMKKKFEDLTASDKYILLKSGMLYELYPQASYVFPPRQESEPIICSPSLPDRSGAINAVQ